MNTNQKGFVNIFLILIAFLAMGAVGYWAGLQQKTEVTSVEPTMDINTENNPSDVFSDTAKDPTLNWKTYTNTKYGFEFKYPADKYLLNPSDGIDYESAVLVSRSGSGSALLSVAVISSSTSQTLYQYLLAQDKLNQTAYEGTPSVKVLGTQDTVIAGVQSTQRMEDLLAAGFSTLVTYIKKGDKVFRVTAGFDDKTNKITNEEEYNKILTTFKFTNAVTGSNSNLVTYSNSQYGFSIPLTSDWKGYTIITRQWDGLNIDPTSPTSENKITDRGPILVLRHPTWTDKNPREDMPIMIFTPTQWDLVINDKISVGSAPFPPSLLGRNSNYVMALPARYNYDELPGYQEVDKLVHTLKAY